MSEQKYIPLEECKDRVLYRIRSRNLSFGVFNENQSGFVGIREKFGMRYLFTETHWDADESHGTVTPIESLESLPDDIDVRETLGTIDDETKRKVAFDKPVKDGGKGWYYIDTGEPGNIMPCSISNTRLFNWIEEKKKQYWKDDA